MTLYRIADLYSCAGGAGWGYARTGRLKPTGYDIVDRPRYPLDFVQADAVETLKRIIAGDIVVDAIHASPPCQKRCSLTRGTNAHLADRYSDFYPETRELMEATGLPGVIENPSARPDVVLCGEMFGLGVIRHRNFELVNWTTDFNYKRDHKKHRGRVRGYRHGEWFDGPYVAAYGNGGGKASVQEMQDAMGIHWTDVREELTEAIPPAFTHWIGGRLVEHLDATTLEVAA
ncbi:DNA methylase [Streptomyces sp. NPDC005302]|uniref:DNA methylase n=1 Tax=Streptomyces sp. NPDC005302 TaxID=3154675 RepID=UPI0033A517B7